jgi:glycosyltransferase involved in cell wall biosynthesis
MDKISVIIPVYNVKEYLARCIDSVISQTFYNTEIILVDDGSTDGSGEICDTYQKEDKRIKVIHKKNGGLSDARNTGLDNATGQFVTLLDSDDWIELNMLETLYNALMEYDAEISECAVNEVFLDKIEPGTQNLEKAVAGDNLFVLEELAKWKTFKTMACAKLYKMSLFDGTYYPCGRMHEDEFVTYKLFYKSKKSVYVDKALYNYDRTRENSITGKFKEKNLDVCDAYKERLNFYMENHLDKLIPEMENHCFWTYLDKLQKCYHAGIYTDRVKKIIGELRENYLENISKDIWVGYKISLTILQHSYSLFGVSHENRELQEEILAILREEEWGDSKTKKIQAILEGRKLEKEDLEKGMGSKEEFLYVLEKINKYEDVIIYGAGEVARKLYKVLVEEGLNQKVISFAVTKNSKKRRAVYDRPLLEIKDLVGYKASALVVLAVREVYCDEMMGNLLNLGFLYTISASAPEIFYEN